MEANLGSLNADAWLTISSTVSREAFKLVLLLPLAIPRIVLGVLAVLVLAGMSFVAAYGWYDAQICSTGWPDISIEETLLVVDQNGPSEFASCSS